MHGYKLVYEGEDSPKGKFWSITPFEDKSGLWIEYGALGARPRSLSVPISKCEAGSLAREMDRRCDAKVGEGYVYVDSDVPARKPPSLLTGTAIREETKPKGGDRNSAILANVHYDNVVDFADFRKRVHEHLLSVLVPEKVEGAVAVTNTHDGVRVTISRPRPQASDEFELRLKNGCTVHRDDELSGLCMASLASAFPEIISLVDQAGDPLSPKDLAMMITKDDEKLLESLRILAVVSLAREQPLGAWFF